ncbi:MAG: hypothetical protein UX31_C0005G0036 [Candidatus Nomurabacteria bacterium GW2011_GWA1_46_11]|uniref:Cupin type-2 domain-containing protein n=2 Tax=Parcubacteria group TaxID=1794811 RepID=A0A1G1YVT5_9BACT|nr:MAG: hypothetical protein UX29_C0002G0019 [Parcubacteria group bacterium GW2011_GWA2_46_10]KKU22226.1 MAG: hypothetical protein UX31_C0005G0036 [Candidatus Nomurabacteria bacterium GW2011_GWA1_46_11]OGY56482.1 MAG: hypothetical protein A2119_00095 [Candidatus Colwellbacteria bacterium GWA2_46_10]
MKYSLKDANEIGWEGFKAWVYNTSEDFPNLSGLYIELSNRHGKVKSTKSDRAYLVLEGKGLFTIDGKDIPVEEMDLVIVPKDTPYDYKTEGGTVKMFLIHSPAYDRDAEVKLDE